MSDVQARSRSATYGDVPFNRDLYLRSCAKKGAISADARAALLGIGPKMAYLYEYGHTAPHLPKARQIARILGVKIDRLWPEEPAAASKAAA